MEHNTPTTEPPSAPYPTLQQLMTVSEKTEPANARISNRMMVFSMLFPQGRLSRAAIGRRTGLSKVSVSEVVLDLIDQHILKEFGSETRKRPGKRGTLVGVDPEYWNIVVVDLSQPYLIQGAVTNLLGLPIAHAETPVSQLAHETPEAVLDLCATLIGKASGHVLGLGIAVSGAVTRQGVVIDSSNLGWRDVDLRRLAEDRFHVPVYVDNDANSALFAERFFGRATPNSIFVWISMGVGAAVLVDDSAVLGVNHAAGEIGHVIVDPAGPACVCGRHGCLEALLSPARIRRTIEGHPERQQDVVTTAGRWLGKTLAMPVSLLDLSDVVVYGPADIVNDVFLAAAEQTVNDFISSNYHRPITVRRCECGSNIVIRGESIAVLQERLREPQPTPSDD